MSYIDRTEEKLYFLIGDVHGCATEFGALLEKCTKYAHEQNSDYEFIVLGDVIDRGPYFAQVFDIMEAFDVELIVGNHEHNFALESLSGKYCGSKARAVSHDIYNAHDSDTRDRIMTKIVTSPYYGRIYSPKHDIIFSHSVYTNIEHISRFDEIRRDNTNVFDFCSRSYPIDMNKMKRKDKLVTYVHGHMSWSYFDNPYGIDVDKNFEFYNIDGGLVFKKTDEQTPHGELVALCIDNRNERIKIKKIVQSVIEE